MGSLKYQLFARTVQFLQGILSSLQSLALSQPEHSETTTEDDIAEHCINFNLKRSKAYQTRMLRRLQRCMKMASLGEAAGGSNSLSLRSSLTVPEDKSLADWLQSFLGFDKDLPGLCRYAYQQRSIPILKELQKSEVVVVYANNSPKAPLCHAEMGKLRLCLWLEP